MNPNKSLLAAGSFALAAMLLLSACRFNSEAARRVAERGQATAVANAQEAIAPVGGEASPLPVDAAGAAPDAQAAAVTGAPTETVVIPAVAAESPLTVTVVMTGDANTDTEVVLEVVTNTADLDATEAFTDAALAPGSTLDPGVEILTDTVDAMSADAPDVVTDTEEVIVEVAPTDTVTATVQGEQPVSQTSGQTDQPQLVTSGSDASSEQAGDATAARRVTRRVRILRAACRVAVSAGANQRVLPTVAARRLAVLASSSRFVATARSRDGKWVYGVSKRGRGWVAVSTLRCAPAPARLVVRR